jgi:hypothetical protein
MLKQKRSELSIKSLFLRSNKNRPLFWMTEYPLLYKFRVNATEIEE